MVSVTNLTSGIQWKKARRYKGYTFVPIVGGGYEVPDIVVNTEDLSGLVISELEEEQVGTVRISSRVKGMVLVLPGVILHGGRQNRTAVRPFIINYGREAEIQVNCVEENRWQYTGGGQDVEFAPSATLLSSDVRQSLNLETPSQTTTWAKIRSYKKRGVLDDSVAPTENFLEIQEEIVTRRREFYEEARSMIEPAYSVEGQRGILVIKGAKPVQLEVFGSTSLWDSISEKLLESQLVDLSLETEDTDSDKDLQTTFDISKVSLDERDPMVDERCYRVEVGGLSGWLILAGETPVYLVASDVSSIEEEAMEHIQVQHELLDDLEQVYISGEERAFWNPE